MPNKLEYKVNVSIKKDISEKEKLERINQFQNAFVIAATDYFSNKKKKISIA